MKLVVRLVTQCSGKGAYAERLFRRFVSETISSIKNAHVLEPSAMSRPISSHVPTPGHCCTGDELCPRAGADGTRLGGPVMPEDFGVVRTNRKREQVFCGKKTEMGATCMIISNPQSNPQCMMSCTTSAYFGSPRGLVSYCNT